MNKAEGIIDEVFCVHLIISTKSLSFTWRLGDPELLISTMVSYSHVLPDTLIQAFNR